jgi:hypothetical protein
MMGESGTKCEQAHHCISSERVVCSNYLFHHPSEAKKLKRLAKRRGVKHMKQ